MPPVNEELIRNLSSAALAALIANRDNIEGLVEVDEEAAQAELDRILTQHAPAIAGLGVSEVFRLVGAVADPDPAAYERFVKALSDEALAAEAEANADELEGLLAALASKRALADDLKATAFVVVRGALVAALVAAFPAAAPVAAAAISPS